MRTTPRGRPAPAMLRLVQLAVLGRWRDTGEQLYREVVRLTEAGRGCEILVSGCGDGTTAEWLARRTQASVTGVDPNLKQIERAEARARGENSGLPLSYQHAALDDLPHETGVFDIVVGEPALAATASPARAVAEMARVTKPLGAVVLLQLTWGSELTEDERGLLVERLGLHPHHLIEWKQMLRGAGVVDIQVQDWTSGAPGCRTRSGMAREMAEATHLTWPQKVQIATRSWSIGRGARRAIEREVALLRDLSDERAIGFQVIKGVKWPRDGLRS